MSISNTLARFSRDEVRILLNGPTGTGKERLAFAVYKWAGMKCRTTGKFSAYNCASINESTALAELFGAKKGSFTGATADTVGIFHVSAAREDMIFLDEIHHLSSHIWSMLLRVLGEKTFLRVGDQMTVFEFHGNVVAASSRDMGRMIEGTEFPQDLYSRLNTSGEIFIPPFEDRAEEHRRLVIKSGFERYLGTDAMAVVEQKVIERLLECSFPGNIRDLMGIIGQLSAYARKEEASTGQRMVTSEHLNRVMKYGEWISPKHGNARSSKQSSRNGSVLSARKARIYNILLALQETNGNVSSASKRLKVSRSTVTKALQSEGITDWKQALLNFNANER